MDFQRFYVEKREEYNRDAITLKQEIISFLKFDHLTDVRVISVYDLIGVTKEEANLVYERLLWDPVLDKDVVEQDSTYVKYRYEAVEGQYDQRADSTSQLASLLLKKDVEVITSKIVAIKGLTEKEVDEVKSYHLNPVEYTEIPLEAFTYVKREEDLKPIPTIDNFIVLSDDEVIKLGKKIGLGMDRDDLLFCRDYFKSEKRNPTETELKMIETYWSDHCRHTTFLTEIENLSIEEGEYQKVFQNALDSYLASREFVNRDKKPMTLMDLATINSREVKAKGLLPDLEDSEEVNAASIEVDVKVDGKSERWLLMFKNETHNHPTEIEPFGGASTCLGGAIRDPLSGRSYVYQAMRITGAGNPFTAWEDTLDGKLPQRKITKAAMEGYSSYGYQIGAATGLVREFYHEGFKAKRMELGALVAAVKKENVTRGKAEPGDVIVLLGGDTGRDGLGAAVGSSKGHTEDSLTRGGTDVQKGNPLVERKIVRLFRKPEVSKMIKVCNDFGAGGVSVAIGELADGLEINLNKVPVKYPGLNGTEIALSESQERMAVVLDDENLEQFMAYAEEEDCQAVVVAKVTHTPRVVMKWNNQNVVDIARSFLDTNGVTKQTDVVVESPKGNYFKMHETVEDSTIIFNKLVDQMNNLRFATQRNLAMSFDSTVGGQTVLLPYGGKKRMTPIDGMVAKLPVLEGETSTTSIMTFGYDPYMSEWSPYHAGYYAVLQSLARFTALGGDASTTRLTFQEYFERLKTDKIWGKPFAALLGAFIVQKSFDTPSIGGKDSMSGSFEELSVPPTIVAFAVGTEEIENIVSPELKEANHQLVWVHFPQDDFGLVDLQQVKSAYKKIYQANNDGHIYAMANVDEGGVAKKIVDMAMGNGIGVELSGKQKEKYFVPYLADLIIEVDDVETFFDLPIIELGETIDLPVINLGQHKISLHEIGKSSKAVLEPIFSGEVDKCEEIELTVKASNAIETLGTGKAPKVLIPIFFGSHGEYTLAQRFMEVGAEVKSVVIKTSNFKKYDESVKLFAAMLDDYDILAIPDGSVFGEEPEFGGKFLGMFLREERVLEAVKALLNRKGLVLGVGDGFAGLLQAGYFEEELGSMLTKESPVMSYHRLNRFISSINDIQVTNNESPWFHLMTPGDYYSVPVATQLGRLILPRAQDMLDKGMTPTVYVNKKGRLVNCLCGNPTGSDYQVESLLGHNGQILGTTASIDRVGKDLYLNRVSKGEHKIFESAVAYFK